MEAVRVRKLKWFSALVLASSVGACSLAGGSGPANADKEFYQDINAGNLKGALHLLYLGKPPTGPDAKLIIRKADETMSALVATAEESFKSYGGLKDLYVVHKKVNDDKASIVLRFVFNDGHTKINTDQLMRVNGKWQLVLNSTDSAVSSFTQNFFSGTPPTPKFSGGNLNALLP
jgi:hypothetical protein